MRYLIGLLILMSCSRDITNPLDTPELFIHQLKKSTFYYVKGDGYWSNDVDSGIECLIKEKPWKFEDGSIGKIIIIWISDADLLQHGVDKIKITNIYDDTFKLQNVPHTWCNAKVFSINKDGSLNTFETIEGWRYSHDSQYPENHPGLFQKLFKDNNFIQLPSKFKLK